MKDRRELRGRTALVTGASSGIGAEIARELAARGAALVLAARREDRLRAVAEPLQRAGSPVRTIAVDLAAPEGPATLEDFCRAEGVTVDVLVNNAGFGLHGRFLDLPWDREREMLDLDVLSLVDLTKRFARPMVARGFGRILQVASIGAFQPSPSYATYAAAKAFVMSFGEALRHELRGTGVSCTVVAPGVTRTEFFEVAGQRLTRYQRAVMMPAGRVAREAVEALLRERAVVVPGRLNAATACFTARLLPRRAAAAIAARLMEG